MNSQNHSIHNLYEMYGVDQYYKQFSKHYNNPHSDDIIAVLNCFNFSNISTVLDMACGDGIISKNLPNNIIIEGNDLYMSSRYERETHNKCYSYSFDDIALNKHSLPKYDLMIMSYAYDLIPHEFKQLFLLYSTFISDNLLLIRPNSKQINHQYWQCQQIVKHGKSTGILYKKL